MDALNAFLDRVAAILPPGQQLLVAICFASGLVFLMVSVHRFVVVGEERGNAHHRRHSYGQAFGFLIVGILLIALDDTLSNLLGSLFGSSVQTSSSASEIMAYAPNMLGVASGTAGEAVLINLVRVAQFIGLLAVVRGLFKLAKSPENPGSGLVRQGLVQIVAGIMAIDLPRTVGLIEQIAFG